MKVNLLNNRIYDDSSLFLRCYKPIILGVVQKHFKDFVNKAYPKNTVSSWDKRCSVYEVVEPYYNSYTVSEPSLSDMTSSVMIKKTCLSFDGTCVSLAFELANGGLAITEMECTSWRENEPFKEVISYIEKGNLRKVYLKTCTFQNNLNFSKMQFVQDLSIFIPITTPEFDGFVSFLRNNKVLKRLGLFLGKTGTRYQTPLMDRDIIKNILESLDRDTLISLDFSDAGIGKNEVSCIADYLSTDPALEILNISSNHLSTDGFESLARGLLKNTRLQVLDIRDNYMKVSEVMSEAISKHKSLRSIGMPYYKDLDNIMKDREAARNCAYFKFDIFQEIYKKPLLRPLLLESFLKNDLKECENMVVLRKLIDIGDYDISRHVLLCKRTFFKDSDPEYFGSVADRYELPQYDTSAIVKNGSLVDGFVFL